MTAGLSVGYALSNSNSAIGPALAMFVGSEMLSSTRPRFVCGRIAVE